MSALDKLGIGKKNVYVSHEHCLLMLEVPRTNDKKELAAEQMLAALHGILRPKKELRLAGEQQEHISLEMAAMGQRIRFYIWTPKHLQSFVEGQIYAQYPTVQIYEQSEDYSARNLSQSVIHHTELTLTDDETLPIKTFPSFEVDPLAAITATLAKLDKEDEEMWIQIIARPISDDWHRMGTRAINRIKRGGSLFGSGSGIGYAADLLAALARPPASAEGAPKEVSERDRTRISAIEEKTKKLGYQVKVRILYAGHDQHTARLRMQALVGAFKQFNTTNLNGFTAKATDFNRARQSSYQSRSFTDHGFILNIEELASIFHLPHTSVETPNIVWSNTKTAEPPSNLPIPIKSQENILSQFGVTNFRGDNRIFGLLRNDRARHVYILGQTGTGKSGALELLTLSDIYFEQGFAVIDPHGDYAQHILKYIPSRRVDDVVYFNPADTDYPVGFNPLEITDPTLKGNISSELVGVLKRLFAESWGPRLEYILRYALLALLDYPNSTMLDITRMLTDKKFRQEVIEYIDDPVVKNFWMTEFASWNDKFATEAVAPVLNKVGAFIANPMIRNIIGQPKSTFNIRQIMDQGKILVVNLSRGLMGEDNAGVLGAMMITKIQLAAMGRADMPEADRRPFYLYVDEFQNFATDSFAVILSEARKYALNLTVANQYISQMSQPVRDAVFGNVGTMITFRISPDDAPFLQKYFEPQFEANDLIQQHNRYCLLSMTIDGEKSAAFSAKTLDLPPAPADATAQIVELSRQRYAKSRADVEKGILEATGYMSRDNKINYEVKRDISRPKAQAQINRIDKDSNQPHRQQSDNRQPKPPARHASQSTAQGSSTPVKQTITAPMPDRTSKHGISKVASNLIKTVAGNDVKANINADISRKRRRRRRGRRGKGQSGNAQGHTIVRPNEPQRKSDEEIIRLR